MIFSGMPPDKPRGNSHAAKSRGKVILKRLVLVVVSLPALAAVAGLILAPTVLHPIHRSLTKEQIQEADQVFARVGATREDVSVRANDGVILRGMESAGGTSQWRLGAAGTGELVAGLQNRLFNSIRRLGAVLRDVAPDFEVYSISVWVLLGVRADGPFFAVLSQAAADAQFIVPTELLRSNIPQRPGSEIFGRCASATVHDDVGPRFF
jgi:hypothetical protein